MKNILINEKRRLIGNREEIRAVCTDIFIRLDGSLHRALEAKYGWTAARIRAETLVYRSLMPPAFYSSASIRRESAGSFHYDIRTDAAFRMEVMNQLKQKLLSQREYRLSYQELVLVFSMLRQSFRQYTEIPPDNRSISRKEVKKLLLQMMEQAYVSYLQGGEKGFRTWLLYQDTSYTFALPEERKISPLYGKEHYRYEAEQIIYNRREQESIRKELETQKLLQSRELETFEKKVEQSSQKEVRRIVEYQVNQSIGELSEKVYGRLEKKLENERKRRGM